MKEDSDVHIHVHSEPDPRITELLTLVRHIAKKTNALTEMEKNQMLDLTALNTEVSNNTDVVNSAITLITGLAAEIQASANDPVAIQKIVDDLTSSSTALATAVAANTPAGPPPTGTSPVDVPGAPPADVPPVDAPPADVPPADVPPADVPPADVPPVDVPSAPVDPGTTDPTA